MIEFDENGKQELIANELDVTQMNLKIVEILQQIQQNIPQTKQKIS